MQVPANVSEIGSQVYSASNKKINDCIVYMECSPSILIEAYKSKSFRERLTTLSKDIKIHHLALADIKYL